MNFFSAKNVNCLLKINTKCIPESKGLRKRGANIMTLPFGYDCLEGHVTLSYDTNVAPGYAMEQMFKCFCLQYRDLLHFVFCFVTS